MNDPKRLERDRDAAESRMKAYSREEQDERRPSIFESAAVRKRNADDSHEAMTRAAGEGMMYRRRLDELKRSKARSKKR